MGQVQLKDKKMPYTTTNLYNTLHDQQVELVIDDDSRIYTVLMALEPSDIIQLKLQNNIFINGTRFIINKIENYEPNDRRLTKLELVKLSTGIPQQSSIQIPSINELIGLTTDDLSLWLTTDDNLILTI